MNEYAHDKKGIHPAAAALTGLAVGVVAGAAATALADKQTREKVSRKVESAGNQAKAASDKAHEAWDKHQPRLKKFVEDIKRGPDTAAKRAREASEATEDMVAEKMDKVKSEAEDSQPLSGTIENK